MEYYLVGQDSSLEGAASDARLKQCAKIVSAYVANNNISITRLRQLIADVQTTLQFVGKRRDVAGKLQLKPAVDITLSITNDYLVCLEDGLRFKTLKRHLRDRYGMTPADYREKWGLHANYPMVAPDYARRRSNIAKKIGLGIRSAERF